MQPGIGHADVAGVCRDDLELGLPAYERAFKRGFRAPRRSDAKIAAKQKQIARLELSAKAKEDLKNVALGTSKINYMDPRITVAW